MVFAVRFILILSTFLSLSCKKDDSLDLLQSGGGGNANVESVTIEDFDPQGDPIIIEIGDTQLFEVDVVAPFGGTLTYSWFFNGANQSNSTDTHSIVAHGGNVGNHTLRMFANDGETNAQKIWNVKINSPPSVTGVTTGVPKVSVGSSILITAAASDANSDTLTYTWLLNNAPSALLVGSGNSATLTGDALLVGNVTVSVVVSDGTATDTYSWTAEVNHFPQACNALTQGQICTYGGNPSLGDNENPSTNPTSIRIRPIAQFQDALGNYFIADYDNAVVWYWNRTASSVSRAGTVIPANTFKIIAGTGEYATGSDGLATQTAINRPRGLWYDDVAEILYISDHSGNRVRYVDSSGMMYTGMGNNTSNVDGAPASTHACNSPAGLYMYSGSLYVACSGNTYRLKRWHIATDLAYTVYGNGTNTIGANGVAPTSDGGTSPYDLVVNADGIYIVHMAHHRIRFLNWSGAPKRFWAGTTSDITIANNTVATIIGNGVAGATDGDSLSVNIGNPSGIAVIGDLIYFNVRQGTLDRFYLANNSTSNVTIGTITVPLKTTARFTHITAGYNGSDVAINNGQINEPYGFSIDPTDSNYLVFSDYGNFRLRRLNLTTNRMEVVVGSGYGRSGFNGDNEKPTLEYIFNRPNGLVYENSTDSLFFVDQDNSRIRSIDKYGRIVTALGRGQGNPVLDNDYPTNALMFTALNGTNNQLNGIGLFPDGSLLQLNSRVHNLRVWNRKTAADTYANIFIPEDLVSSIAGNYAVAAGNGPAGTALTSLMNFPSDVLAYDNAGSMEIFVVDQQNHCVKKVDTSGNTTFVLGNCGDATPTDSTHDVPLASLEMNRPHGIAIDEYGNLIVSDTFNHKIRYWNRTASSVTFGSQTINPGRVVTIACFSGTGGSTSENIFATSSRCDSPMGLDYHNGRLCFANFGRHNVRCINRTDGRVNTVAGRPVAVNLSGGPAGMEQEGVAATTVPLNNPVDVSFDDQGDLYITDRNNHIIRKVKLSP
jgi:hypothetical protein